MTNLVEELAQLKIENAIALAGMLALYAEKITVVEDKTIEVRATRLNVTHIHYLDTLEELWAFQRALAPYIVSQSDNSSWNGVQKEFVLNKPNGL